MTQAAPTPASAHEMLDRMEQFFRHYLHCSPEQRTVLQFWTLHTHCFAAANTTPYLFIHSPEKESGKTLCLQLLDLLCDDPWFSAAVTPAVLVGKLAAQHSTVLLDDCHSLFSPASRARVCALLMQGARRGGTFSLSRRSAIQDLDVFCPKAFAGDFLLPANITGHFIPIGLFQNFDYGYFRRFRLHEAQAMALPVVESLKAWATAHLDALKQAAPFPFDEFHIHLSPRELDCMEPLLQIASLLGGDWPAKLLSALDRICLFKDDHVHRVYLLSDIRDFFEEEKVDRLASREILAHLNRLNERPWKEWNNGRSMKTSDLAQLLHRLDIKVHNQRHGSGKRGQGYDIKDFESQFRRWLPEHDARLDRRFEDPLLLE